MGRVYNFSAGPAALPLAVLERARDEMTDFAGTGMSVMELSHRGKPFREVAERSEAALRRPAVRHGPAESRDAGGQRGLRGYR